MRDSETAHQWAQSNEKKKPKRIPIQIERISKVGCRTWSDITSGSGAVSGKRKERERERERADSWGGASEWRCWPLVVSCHCSPNVSRWQTRRWGTLSHSTPPKQWIQPNSSVPLLIHYVVLLKWKTPAHQQTFKQQWLTRQFSNFSSTLPLLLRLLLLRLHSTISIVRKRNADAATDTTVRRVRTGQCLPRASLCLSLFL